MNWKRVVGVFGEELSRWLDSKKPKVAPSGIMDEGDVNVYKFIQSLESIRLKGIKRLANFEVAKIEIDDKGYLIWSEDVIGQEIKGLLPDAEYEVITKNSIFVPKNSLSDTSASVRFFMYCIEELWEKTDRISQWKEISKVRSVFIKFEPTLQTIINTMNESLEATGTVGSDEVVDKYINLLNRLYSEAEAAYTDYKQHKDEIEALDRQAISKSHLERLEYEESYLNYTNRFKEEEKVEQKNQSGI